jgi:hypothetical protein
MRGSRPFQLSRDTLRNFDENGLKELAIAFYLPLRNRVFPFGDYRSVDSPNEPAFSGPEFWPLTAFIILQVL